MRRHRFKPCARDEPEELLKHLEKDFATQLVKTAVRHAEAGQPTP